MNQLKDKNILGIENEKFTFLFGMILLFIEIIIMIVIFITRPSLFLKIISMVTAFHLGGRLAIIGTGLELNFSAPTIMAVTLTYLTTFLLIWLSVIGFLWVKAKNIKPFNKFVETRMEKAKKRAKVMKKWSWIGIVIFVWMPFPMTGAIMGFFIARAEGYKSLTSISMAIPSMWVGVICWTLWFDDLYRIIEKIGPRLTTYMTFLLVALPVIFYLTKMLIKKIISWNKAVKHEM